MNRQLTSSRQRLLFLLGVLLIYAVVVIWLDFLQGPMWVDEVTFWETSENFSENLIPTIDDLRDYTELNTPLPFIIFGALEHIFSVGIVSGRLLNLILSIIMVFMIGWPSQNKGGRAILCVLGLFLCPYYLRLSGRAFTEMIACFWLTLGLIGYVRNRYVLSNIGFILAIASRQYMIAFPAAIVSYEFIISIVKVIRLRRIRLAEQWKWLAPLIGASSILGWFLLFGGLAPSTAIEVRPTPEVQLTLWALTPGGAFNFLAFVGLHIVIPEFLLFKPKAKLRLLRRQKRKVIIVAAGLLLCFLVFPPLPIGIGLTVKISNLIPLDIFRLSLFYTLALLACIRFLKPNLMFLIVLFNCLIMMKVFPFDRYVLPMAVAFWYLKSVGLENQLIIFKDRSLIPKMEE